MIFHVPNKDIQYLTLKIDNVIIEKVVEFNFLGLTMDTNLNWKKHSEKISNKCTKMIGILNRLKYVLPLGIKIMLYNTLILPHINYCIMAWGYKGTRLLKIQKKAVHIITLSGYSRARIKLKKMHSKNCYTKLILCSNLHFCVAIFSVMQNYRKTCMNSIK